jgi:hypothetical protein
MWKSNQKITKERGKAYIRLASSIHIASICFTHATLST